MPNIVLFFFEKRKLSSCFHFSTLSALIEQSHDATEPASETVGAGPTIDASAAPSNPREVRKAMLRDELTEPLRKSLLLDRRFNRSKVENQISSEGEFDHLHDRKIWYSRDAFDEGVRRIHALDS